MKRFYLLSLLLPLLYSSQAQSFQIKVDDLGNAPAFSESFLSMNGIRTVHITTSTEARPGKLIAGPSVVREYNSSGLLLQEVELTGEADTSRIAAFFYNDNDILGWKQETDMKWGKVFRTGYRFLGEDQPYQERDYEMLANEQVMLLETKQYTYTETGQLESILFKQGNQVIKTHEYSYSDLGQVLSEITTNKAGETVSIVNYTYYENGSINKVTAVADGADTKTYSFLYDDNGLPTQIDWTTGEAESGSITYEYNQAGSLLAMEESSSSQATVRRAFSYEKFQAESTVSLAER